MTNYKCTIEIDVFDADSPVAAARDAYTHLQSPEAMPWVIDVTDEKGVTTRVDLNEEPPSVQQIEPPKRLIPYVPRQMQLRFGDVGLIATGIYVDAIRPWDHVSNCPAGPAYGELWLETVLGPDTVVKEFLTTYSDVGTMQSRSPIRLVIDDVEFEPEYLQIALYAMLSGAGSVGFVQTHGMMCQLEYATAKGIQDYLAESHA